MEPTNGGEGYVTFVASNPCGETILCKPIEVNGHNCGSGYLIIPNPYSCTLQGRLNSTNFFSIYPNPSSSYFNVNLIDENQKPINSREIFGELLDLNGINIRDIEINYNQATVNTENIRKGIYIFRIKYDGKTESHQVIVE